MIDTLRNFYEKVGRYYPEDEITYSTISGLLRKKWLLKKFQMLAPGSLLDCGCNVGRLSAQWQKGVAYGVDISFAVLERGKQRFSKINFIHGDLQDLTFIKPGSIRNAIAIEVLEHLDRPGVFLENLYAVIQDNGFIIITVPGYTGKRIENISLGIMRSFGIKQGTKGTLYRHKTYKPQQLAHLVEQAGFQVLETGSFERELRLWQKPITLIQNLFDKISERFFPDSKINYFFLQAIERTKINLYYTMDIFSLPAILLRIFKEGRRSYVIARK